MGGFTPLLVRSAAVAALGSFLFGFDTAVISGTTDALRLRFGLDSNQLGLTVASALIGTIFGSLGAGKPAERFGRRPVLMGVAVLYFLSALGCGLAWELVSLVIAPLRRRAWRSARPRSSRRSTSRRSRRRPCAAGWSRSASSTSFPGSWLAYFSNYFIAQIVGRPRDRGVALDARVATVPSALFFLPRLPHPREPALAGEAAPQGRGDGGSASDGQRAARGS